MSPHLLIGLILLGAALVRLPYVTDPFLRLEEFGMSQFSVYAENFHRFGYLDTGLLPIFGKVGETYYPYANHPPLASIFLGLWTSVFGNTELAARALSILFGLGTILVVYLLGRRCFSEKVGLWGAFFMAFTPLQMYMNHYYTMEIPQTFFTLLALLFVLRWDESQKRSDLGLAVLCLVLGYECDVYPAFWTPVFFLWGVLDLRQKAERSKILGWGLLTAVGPLCVLGQLVHLKVLGWAQTMMVGGVSKYSTPWDYWVDPNYHIHAVTRLFQDSAWLPAIAALVALRHLKSWNRAQRVLLTFLLLLPVADYLVLAKAVHGHHYRVMFFFPLMAILAGITMAEVPLSLSAVLVVGFSFAAYPKTVELYQILRPNDIETSRQIKELTTERDILVALPPHMTYYVGRPAVLPYYYLWRHAGLHKEPEKLFAELHHLARETDYDRIIVFTQFILPPEFPPVDWSKTFDGVDNLERVTEPGIDPQVWKFVR